MPLFSVIMPAYNAATFITEAIVSVMLQSEQAWELIVVNDGSTDNTRELLQPYVQADKRIVYTELIHSGQGTARNKGVELAVGPFIAFLDADDIWETDFLREQHALINQAGADLVYANCNYIGNRINPVRSGRYSRHLYLKGRTGISALLRNNDVPLSTVLMKKSSFLNCGGFKENTGIQYAEDFDLWIRLLGNGCVFIGNQKILAKYRLHAAQSSRSSVNRYEQMLAVIHSIPEELQLEQEKKTALAIWLRRLLVASKRSGNQELLMQLTYLPSSSVRFICRFSALIMPPFLLRRCMYVLTFFV